MSISSRRDGAAAPALAVALALASAAMMGAFPVAAARDTARDTPADRAALARLRSIEFETALAREPKIYLVLAPRAGHLEIKSRAMVLERVAIDALLLLEFEPLFSQAESPQLSAPTLWKITQGPGDTDRETIAPVELRPYSEEEDKEEPVAANAPGTGAAAAPQKKKPDETVIPTSYRATLDNGWQLYVTADRPQSSFFQRFVSSVLDGWQRLRGKEPQHPPLITLVVAPAAAQRLHHLLRSGTEILVLP